jgi:hypothetical protein
MPGSLPYDAQEPMVSGLSSFFMSSLSFFFRKKEKVQPFMAVPFW